MKLFKGKMFGISGDFEAFKDTAYHQILITHNSFLYFIYSGEENAWHKYSDAGNYKLDPRRYQEITKEELTKAMGGKFPQKETDFLRLCRPSELLIVDMMPLLREEYPTYMDAEDPSIRAMVHSFLIESDICYKSFLAVVKLLDSAVEDQQDYGSVLEALGELILLVLGRDIYSNEIRIVDGHDTGSSFWIMPVRVIDYSNTNGRDTVATKWINEISIDQWDVQSYLVPFLYQYFDPGLKANQKRVESTWVGEDGEMHADYVKGFEWNLTHNFYTYDAFRKILGDMRETVDALASGRENRYTVKLREEFNRNFFLPDDEGSGEEKSDTYRERKAEAEREEIKRIIDFYRRFMYRMEYMITVGGEKGYDLISVMGP